MNVKFYSSGCPKCNVLETKLNQENIQFELITNQEEIEMACREANTDFLPILNVDGNFYCFSEAISWINKIK